MSRIQLFGFSILTMFAAVSATGISLPARAADAPPPGFAGAKRAPVSPKAGALIDLTGNWVAIVNEDWRLRMVTPQKGDYEGLMMTTAGIKQAGTWTPAMDGSCKAYGVGALLRMPTRLKISWEGEDVLKIETDAGMQTRRLLFTKAPASGPPTLQGYSVASWEALVPQPAPNPMIPSEPVTGGTLKVTTTNHTAAWLRRNGAPYSENASIVEYFDRWPGPDGSEWLSVTTIVEDPVNLMQRSILSSHFRKEANASKWRPKPCTPIAD